MDQCIQLALPIRGLLTADQKQYRYFFFLIRIYVDPHSANHAVQGSTELCSLILVTFTITLPTNL